MPVCSKIFRVFFRVFSGMCGCCVRSVLYEVTSTQDKKMSRSVGLRVYMRTLWVRLSYIWR